MIERILLATDGRGARPAVAALDEVAGGVLDAAEIRGAEPSSMSCRRHARLRAALAGSDSRAGTRRAGRSVMVVREPGSRL